VLIIAMTASAIQGDREKCLESGMNNYLAKPVRAQTLKALLESYLNKEDQTEIPNLASEAKLLVSRALEAAEKASGTETTEKSPGTTTSGVGAAQKETAARASVAQEEDTGVPKARSRPIEAVQNEVETTAQAEDAEGEVPKIRNRPRSVRMSTTNHILPNGKREPVRRPSSDVG
jgi:response regulator RpfG family c-di-GMP phosphodiesterase